MRFERRSIIVRTMNKQDVVNYYDQIPDLSEEEKKQRISVVQKKLGSIRNDISSTIILTVEEKGTGKLIGTIVGKKIGAIEDIKLSIPSERRLERYGYEVVDQFKKICHENWPEIRKIKLNKDRVAEEYLKKSGLDRNTQYI